MRLFDLIERRWAEVDRTKPADFKAATLAVIDDGVRLLANCTDKQLAQELRNPSTALVALRNATQSEALARILLKKFSLL